MDKSTLEFAFTSGTLAGLNKLADDGVITQDQHAAVVAEAKDSFENWYAGVKPILAMASNAI